MFQDCKKKLNIWTRLGTTVPDLGLTQASFLLFSTVLPSLPFSKHQR